MPKTLPHVWRTYSENSHTKQTTLICTYSHQHLFLALSPTSLFSPTIPFSATYSDQINDKMLPSY